MTEKEGQEEGLEVARSKTVAAFGRKPAKLIIPIKIRRARRRRRR